MSRLASLQAAFQRYVLHGTSEVAERIEPGPRDNRAQRLSIYHNAYRLRLTEALGSDFEALAALMGPDAFKQATWAYVEATHSSFRNIRWYGGGFTEFLQSNPPWSEQPWLADLARFEWALTLAFDAADEAHLSFGDFASLPADAWRSLVFQLHPSTQLVALRANAPAMRKAVDAQTPLPAIEMTETPASWLIWRKALAPHFRSLLEPEAWALQAAANAASFPAICEGLCEWIAPEEAAGAAAGFLRTWVDDQLISGIQT